MYSFSTERFTIPYFLVDLPSLQNTIDIRTYITEQKHEPNILSDFLTRLWVPKATQGVILNNRLFQILQNWTSEFNFKALNKQNTSYCLPEITWRKRVQYERNHFHFHWNLYSNTPIWCTDSYQRQAFWWISTEHYDDIRTFRIRNIREQIIFLLEIFTYLLVEGLLQIEREWINPGSIRVSCNTKNTVTEINFASCLKDFGYFIFARGWKFLLTKMSDSCNCSTLSSSSFSKTRASHSLTTPLDNTLLKAKWTLSNNL